MADGLRLFISYAHIDKRFVIDQLTPRLGTFHDYWYDEHLKAGQNWEQTIFKEIGRCDAFLYVITPESLASEWCQKEVAEALRLGKAIFPLRLQENIDLPSELSRYQWVDFAGQPFDRGMTDLIGSLATVSRTAPQPTPARPAPTPTADPRTLYQRAADARRGDDHETALRLLNEIEQIDPDFLNGVYRELIADSQRVLDEKVRRRDWEQQYKEIGLVLLDDVLLPQAQKMWDDLRRQFPDITDDPDNLAARLDSTPETSADDALIRRFDEVEVQVNQHRAAYDAGRINHEQLRAELYKLMVLGDDGAWWMVGIETGNWFRFEDGDWQQAERPR
jgi:hypothetical protein